MKVTQITIGRFHHFHLARQLEKHGLLNEIWTGYPKFKIIDEEGITPTKIKTFPWLQAIYMSKGKIGLGNWDWFDKELAWHAKESLDKHVANSLILPTCLIALSGNGLHAGRKAQEIGGKFICDRGSSHIRFQENILQEEYKRFGSKFQGIDPRVIEKEENEYEVADYITLPSEFSKQSFIEMGVKKEKLIKIPYGANLSRFKKTGDPNQHKFTVLFVAGAVTIQKGFFDLLKAFHLFKHPNKELIVLGRISVEMKKMIVKEKTENVIFLGNIANKELPVLYSTSTVFVLPSIQEGFGMVLGEAMACGCPVIASENTGGSDLFTNGKEGFSVPIRNPKAIADKLQTLADSPHLREEMSLAALKKIQSIGGWDDYGNQFVKFIRSI